MGLNPSDFYKSMTTYHDHTLWQDVYLTRTPTGQMAYIKLATVKSGRPVIQFKEK